jgi:hypothetical protein
MDMIDDTVELGSSANGDALDSAPTVTTPIISGIAALGQTLTASATATPADDTLTFDWFSSENNFTSPIATGATFTVTAAGISLDVEAIATNADGVQATATSGEIFTVSGPNIDPNFPQLANSNVDEWILANGKWVASAGLGSVSSGYQAVGTGDFTGTGTSDILWKNPSNGDTEEWLLNAGSWTGTVDLGAHPGNFQIAGVGDFFGNGVDDVLWTSTSGGNVQTDIWELNSSGQWQASVSPGTHPGGYTVAGTGDWTGNGTDGILWYNAATGNVDEWQLSNGQWSASVELGAHPGSGWTIAGVGDFFGNGRDDVLWSNTSGGGVQTDIWELGSNGQWINSVSPGSHPAGYQVVGVGDFTGTGTSDILWQNPTTGDVDEWLINNGKWAGSIDLGSHPGNFQVAGIGNFTGSGTSSILWHAGS